MLDALEPKRATARLLEEAVEAFEARGGALSLDLPEELKLVRGTPFEVAVFAAPIRHEGRVLGRLELGPRRGGRHYSEADQRALREAADAVGDAIDFAIRMASAGARG
ncbi:MAG TPA: GAF domain-containing protein [Candidatus Limnocylindrales bacterium]|nr:GAF domain-containing protein [Candidatus Limnocylindrales bacterium]